MTKEMKMVKDERVKSLRVTGRKKRGGKKKTYKGKEREPKTEKRRNRDRKQKEAIKTVFQVGGVTTRERDEIRIRMLKREEHEKKIFYKTKKIPKRKIAKERLISF